MARPGIHVLIVEDDTVDRRACRRALSRHPDLEFAFTEADTAADGLRQAQAGAPALILLDYQLPDLDGLEFLGRLAGSRGEPAVPVVMLTGADNVAVAVEAMRRGARDYLVKDTEGKYLELLPTVLTRVLREQRLREEKQEAVERLRRAERELQQRRAETAHVLRLHTAGEMVSAIAHELNQPLHAVTTYCEAAQRMLRTDPLDAENLARALEQTALQAQRAAYVIRELRAFLRREAPTLEPLDINELVREALMLLAADSHGNGFRVEFTPAAALPPVAANRVQIEQALLNLLRNGIEAMRGARPAGGALDVRTSLNEEGLVQVTVSDSGPGIDPETRGRIFEPFFSSKSDGLGLGLAISRSIVEAHGGRLWADPRSGPGAVFHFTLPPAP